jgi:hypothetical protein
MADPTSEKHYESKFVFPLFKLIKERAEEKDISYHDAAREVIPEYVKTIRYGDIEFENRLVSEHDAEFKAEVELWEKKIKKLSEGGQ